MRKASIKSLPPTPNIFTGQIPFLSPNQQCQSTEGRIIDGKQKNDEN